MTFLLNKTIPFIIGGLIFLFHSVNSFFKPEDDRYDLYNQQVISGPDKNKGYKDIICYKEKFLAVGTDGRIDYIDISGERSPAGYICKNDLNCVVYENQMLVIGGADGIILFSSDGHVFNKVNSGTNNNINDIVFYNGLLITGADKGTILISLNGKSWSIVHLPVKGNIMSLSANDSFCIGITDNGEIIRSDDGLNWEITDYNQEYGGYNKSCKFKKVTVTTKRIVLVGIHNDGSPAVLFSSLGNVWTERSLIYNDNHGMIQFLRNKPNDITYDPARDQFILACDNGELFSLPSCTKCNVLFKVSSNDLSAVICTDNILVSAGEDFFINIINL